MKKAVLSAAIAVFSLSAASFAMAGGSDQSSNIPQGGLYVGAGLGWGAMVTPPQMLTNQQILADSAVNATHNQNYFSARANVGYLFQLTNSVFLGPEFGYNYLPNTRYSYNSALFYRNNNGKLTDYALDLLAVAKYYVNAQFDVFGKAGAALVRQRATYMATSPIITPSAADINQTVTRTSVLPELAVGLGYNVTSAVEATLTYAHAFGKNKNDLKQSGVVYSGAGVQQQKFGSAVPSYNTVLVGMNYNFGQL